MPLIISAEGLGTRIIFLDANTLEPINLYGDITHQDNIIFQRPDGTTFTVDGFWGDPYGDGSWGFTAGYLFDYYTQPGLYLLKSYPLPNGYEAVEIYSEDWDGHDSSGGLLKKKVKDGFTVSETTTASGRSFGVSVLSSNIYVLVRKANDSSTQTPTPTLTDEIKVLLNGTAIIFDQPPIIENGRTLVPLRAIFEALGATVEWEQSTQTVTAVKDDITITLKIGDNSLVKIGVRIQLDVPAMIVNGRTLVPVRAISESFGVDVEWDGDNRTVILTDVSNNTSNATGQKSSSANGLSFIEAGINFPGLSLGAYEKFMSFGELVRGGMTIWGEVPRQLLGWDTAGINLTPYFVSSDLIYYYVDESDYLCVVIAEYKPVFVKRTSNVTNAEGTHTVERELPEMTFSQRIWIYRYNQNYSFIDKKSINTSAGFDLWGGFHAGSDGHYYVAVGRINTERSETATVINIHRYDRNWNLVGTGSVQGKPQYDGWGIGAPFRNGNCSMLEKDGILYIHTSRVMTFGQGTGHQANISFVFDTATMQEITISPRSTYVSHSFQQLLATDGEFIYFLDHGDAHPRSIRLTVLVATSNENTTNIRPVTKDLFDFLGAEGNNATGAMVGAMEVSQSNVLIAGASQPHNNAVMGKTGWGSDFKENIYLITVANGGGDVNFKWITNYDPNGNIETESPRLMKINDDRFILMYNIVEDTNRHDLFNNTGRKESRTLECVVLDGAGNVIKRVSYPDIFFADSSNPILYNGDIVWVSPTEKDNYYFIPLDERNEPLQIKTTYLHRIPYQDILGY